MTDEQRRAMVDTDANMALLDQAEGLWINNADNDGDYVRIILECGTQWAWVRNARHRTKNDEAGNKVYVEGYRVTCVTPAGEPLDKMIITMMEMRQGWQDDWKSYLAIYKPEKLIENRTRIDAPKALFEDEGWALGKMQDTTMTLAKVCETFEGGKSAFVFNPDGETTHTDDNDGTVWFPVLERDEGCARLWAKGRVRHANYIHALRVIGLEHKRVHGTVKPRRKKKVRVEGDTNTNDWKRPSRPVTEPVQANPAPVRAVEPVKPAERAPKPEARRLNSDEDVAWTDWNGVADIEGEAKRMGATPEALAALKMATVKRKRAEDPDWNGGKAHMTYEEQKALGEAARARSVERLQAATLAQSIKPTNHSADDQFEQNDNDD